MTRNFSSKALVAAALAAALLAATAGVGDSAPGLDNDIDGDGYGDVVVGIPNENIGSTIAAGMVAVIFGDSGGLTTAGDESHSQRGPIPGRAEAEDFFGSAVELVDINADGYADAVIGAAGETIGEARSSGTVTVIPGSANGLVPSESITYRQGKQLPGGTEFGDFFGWAIASGDFDGDGFPDVVVSAPFEDLGGVPDAGAVIAMYGSADGINAPRSQFFSQAGPINGAIEAFDSFGWALASGDFNGDGFDDVAAGVPGEDIGSIENAGSVNVWYGSASGLTTDGDIAFSQSGAIVSPAETTDVFGYAVGATDINCDGIDDLLVGAPNEDFGNPQTGGIANGGYVHVILGSTNGLTTDGNVGLRAGRNGIPGSLANNLSGQVLAGGDFNGDGCGDLAFGSPEENIDGVVGAGSVTVVYGDAAWPTNGGTALFSQDGPIPGAVETDDKFGTSLGVVDVNGDGRDDLVVGIPLEDIGSVGDAGGIVVIQGSANGLTTGGSKFFSQSGPINGAPEPGDLFGSSLSDSEF